MFCPFGRVSAQLNMIKADFLNGVELENEAFNFMVDTLDPDIRRMIVKMIDGKGLCDLKKSSPQVVCYCGIICALKRELYNILAQHWEPYVGNPNDLWLLEAIPF